MRRKTMMLDSKHAMVFAATGAIGGEVARKFAREGAHVYVSGRRREALDALVEEIASEGGRASASVVDATDPAEVADHVAGAEKVDVAFNAIGLPPEELGYPARSTDLDLDVFMKPQRIILASTFLTSRSAAARMASEGGGSIVMLSATLTGVNVPFMASLTATCGAIEAMTRTLAAEFGQAGVRVNCLRGDAMPETSTIQQTGAGQASLLGIDVSELPMAAAGTLARPRTLAETAAAAAFLASDAASGISSQVLTVSDSAMAG